MQRMRRFLVCTGLAVALTGCDAATVKPNYTTTNPDLLRIGGEAPGNKEPEIIDMGSYCLKVTDKWKADGKTPDGQSIWVKDSYRNVVPCH